MTMINFSVTVELTDEDTLTDEKLEQTLSDLEDLLMRHPAGFDLYDSEWYYDEEGEEYA